MHPSTLTVFSLFEKERRNVVPLFQRPYVWRTERQLRPFWRDVMRVTEDVLRARMEGSKGKLPRAHFVGTVVLNPIRTTYQQVEARDVVDGQQRLTTLQLLLAVICDTAAAIGYTKRDRELERLTLNTCGMEEDHERFKVWPTDTDQSPFERVVTSGSNDEVERRFPTRYGYRKRKPDPKPLVYETYAFFHRALDLYLHKGVTDPSRPADEGEEVTRGGGRARPAP